jgi:VanZ family protein
MAAHDNAPRAAGASAASHLQMPTPPATTHSPHAWRVLLGALLLIICWFAFVPDPPPSVDTGWDKLNHVLAFTAVSACAGFAWGRARHRTAAVLLGSLAFGVFIELVQTQIPGRSGEWPDLLADTIGIALGLAVFAGLSRRWLTP